jgi:dienelactone hydrolase
MRSSFLIVLGALCALCGESSSRAEPLPGARPLEFTGDPAMAMVAGLHKYLDRETAASVEKRKQFWKPDFSSPEAYAKSIQPNRERLKKILGLVDRRLPPAMELVATTDQPALVAETERYRVYAVRWPVLPGVDGEGLLLEPTGKAFANVVAIPDADWTPEMIVGLAPGVSTESQFARRLAEKGCRVVVPTLIDRKDDFSGNAKLNKWTNQSHREFVYRMAYEMGRHVIGYEVQKVLAAVEWFCRDEKHQPVHVIGYGEGGLLAFYSGALDDRIRVTSVSGYFGPREVVSREPIDRNVWGLLSEFGDAEVASGLWPRGPAENGRQARRWLQIDDNARPTTGGPKARPGRSGAAPGALGPLDRDAGEKEYERSRSLSPAEFGVTYSRVLLGDQLSPAIHLFLFPNRNADRKPPEGQLEAPADRRKSLDPAVRQHRQFDQLVAYTQKLWRDSEPVRNDFFWKKTDKSSPEKWQKSCEPLRNYFWEEVIGKLPPPTLPPNPRTRQVYDEPKWTGHEVMLDLYPDVFAYGILLKPKDLQPGEKRPVVVCQHGLEGRPRSCIDAEKHPTYNGFAAKLAELGYIVYCPQNPYIGNNTFRQIQRKAQPLKLSLFSFIVQQHATTLDWLATLPFVDADKMAFYGLSYGGKTAMRVPAILPKYCLSICSGDFNEWIGKNVSVDLPQSYMFGGEYDMMEFDLGNTFNYAEMTGLIAPRPFMVERGHDDPVGTDEMIAYEYAKVRRLYAKLGIPDRTAIEFFNGGHRINGRGTFAFLKQHLGWPR